MNTPLSAPGAKHAPAGKHHDGQGLYLVKSSRPRGKWVLRKTVYGRRREMGLGPFPEVGLAEARQKADDARLLIRLGRDPIGERNSDFRTRRHLLRDITAEAFEARKAELKGDGVAGRWMSPLELHVLPKLGATPVVKLTKVDVATVLRPIWHLKSHTAQKALNRLSIVMMHAAAMGLDVDIQVAAKARALLGKSRHKVQSIPAMDWREVPEFYASLDDVSVVHLALRLLILTGVRSGPLRFASFDQFEGTVWTIPAERMKAREGKAKDFRVPLSTEAMHVVELARKQRRDQFLFPAVRKGVIADASMSRLMEWRPLEARPHGFRSTLRTWLAETTSAPFEVAETMLSHQTLNSVQRAYQRSDFLEQRAELIEAWARHVTQGRQFR